MYGSSTQYKSWTFKSDSDLTNLRKEANQNYIEKFRANRPDEECWSHFLTPSEELLMVRDYVWKLSQFCLDFQDPRESRIRMPVPVTTTATHYFLRYYLYNSVMDHHPSYIMHTCVYLACKIEEFYVTINDYVANVVGEHAHKQLVATAILNSELQTIQELQFHLIVHQPYRPVEGLIIDLKTRYPALQDAESLRPAVEEFLERVHHTDAILHYSPSQLALAAVTTAASKLGQNLDSYVTDILFKTSPDMLKTLIDAVRKIKRFVRNSENRGSPSTIAELERKLTQCRNPVNDPKTEEYRLNQARIEQDDEDFGPIVSSVAVDGITDPTADAENNANTDDGVEVLDTTHNNEAKHDHNTDAITVVDDDDGTVATVQHHSHTSDSSSGVVAESVSERRLLAREHQIRQQKQLQDIMPLHWRSDEFDNFENSNIVGGVMGVGLGVKNAGGIVTDGGVIDDDDDE
uniref:Cyclin-H n=2 Tax=Hirondellea gigas TaxID=1518452 RepID=A0A2P2I1N3_9CRUS